MTTDPTEEEKKKRVEAALSVLAEELDAKKMSMWGGPGEYAVIAMPGHRWLEDGELVEKKKGNQK